MAYSTGRKPWRSEPPREPENRAYDVSQKLFYLGLVVLVVFGILVLQLARMQIVRAPQYQARAENNRLRQVAITPTRGLIYDRNGLPLVENRASYSAAVIPADVPNKQEMEISLTLQELIGVPATEITDKIDARKRSNDPFSPLVLKEDLTQETAFMLRERIAQLPGARVIVEAKRNYVNGPLLSQVVGFVGRIDAEEYASLQSAGYKASERLGKTGVELTYESQLRGVPGIKNVETDASGREIRTLDERPAVAGDSIVLSIDVDLEQKVTEYLAAAMGKSRNAAAVVMDVRTGDILALVSLPTYDNNIFTGTADETAITRLLNDPAKPLLNHAIAEMYPPGSTFKQITGLAALQEGVANANTKITSLGSIQVKNQYNPSIVYTFKDWAALGTLDFYRGVAMSSDVYFYYLAGGYSENGKDLFQGLGAATLARWARKFGLGVTTGVDIPGESEGLVPDPTWKEKTVGEPWTIGDTYNFGIGQGFVAATPLQMVRVTAAIANGGDVLVPHVVKEVRDSSGTVIAPDRRVVQRNLDVDPRNLDIFREGMREAVFDGTAATAKSKAVQVAGKTGTAEFGEQRPDGTYLEHAWFTGYAPFNNPEIAVVVFLEQGNGAINAAPVAARIFDYYFARRSLAGAAP